MRNVIAFFGEALTRQEGGRTAAARATAAPGWGGAPAAPRTSQGRAHDLRTRHLTRAWRDLVGGQLFFLWGAEGGVARCLARRVPSGGWAPAPGGRGLRRGRRDGGRDAVRSGRRGGARG